MFSDIVCDNFSRLTIEVGQEVNENNTKSSNNKTFSHLPVVLTGMRHAVLANRHHDLLWHSCVDSSSEVDFEIHYPKLFSLTISKSAKGGGNSESKSDESGESFEVISSPSPGVGCVEINISLPSVRMRNRMKTVGVVFILCLKVGASSEHHKMHEEIKVDGYGRTTDFESNPHAIDTCYGGEECWMEIHEANAQMAMEEVGEKLQKQYEQYLQNVKYRKSVEPTPDKVRRLSTVSRRNARGERLLFHYNGHGVPKPKENGDIFVFDNEYKKYMPVSVVELETWMGSPSIYVFDCDSAGSVVDKFEEITRNSLAREHQFLDPNNFVYNCIVLGACESGQNLPAHVGLPSDFFTSCLTTPIRMALRCVLINQKYKHSHGRASNSSLFTSHMLDKIPGTSRDRKTMLGQLSFIFHTVTDAIAWNCLPRELFQKLFRQDPFVATLFRHYLLAERLMRQFQCTPTSHPKLISNPASPHSITYSHPMWSAWDCTVNQALSQLTNVIEGHHSFRPLPFFHDHMTAFESWLRFGNYNRSPPIELPIVLQALLIFPDRAQALHLLARFIDLGSWAVNSSLVVGIFPNLKRLLSGTVSDNSMKPMLVFIWAKILTVDLTCQADLINTSSHVYFISILENARMTLFDKSLAAFVLATIAHQPIEFIASLNKQMAASGGTSRQTQTHSTSSIQPLAPLTGGGGVGLDDSMVDIEVGAGGGGATGGMRNGRMILHEIGPNGLLPPISATGIYSNGFGGGGGGLPPIPSTSSPHIQSQSSSGVGVGSKSSTNAAIIQSQSSAMEVQEEMLEKSTMMTICLEMLQDESEKLNDEIGDKDKNKEKEKLTEKNINFNVSESEFNEHWMLQLWLLMCLGHIWKSGERARGRGARSNAPSLILKFLKSDHPDVRAAAIFSLGCFIRSGNSDYPTSSIFPISSSPSMSNTISPRSDQLDFEIILNLIKTVGFDLDSSPIVRRQLMLAIYNFIRNYEAAFITFVASIQSVDNHKSTSSSCSNTKPPLNFHSSVIQSVWMYLHTICNSAYIVDCDGQVSVMSYIVYTYIQKKAEKHFSTKKRDLGDEIRRKEERTMIQMPRLKTNLFDWVSGYVKRQLLDPSRYLEKEMNLDEQTPPLFSPVHILFKASQFNKNKHFLSQFDVELDWIKMDEQPEEEESAESCLKYERQNARQFTIMSDNSTEPLIPRVMAFHPYRDKVAIGFENDLISVIDYDPHSNNEDGYEFVEVEGSDSVEVKSYSLTTTQANPNFDDSKHCGVISSIEYINAQHMPLLLTGFNDGNLKVFRVPSSPYVSEDVRNSMRLEMISTWNTLQQEQLTREKTSMSYSTQHPLKLLTSWKQESGRLAVSFNHTFNNIDIWDLKAERVTNRIKRVMKDVSSSSSDILSFLSPVNSSSNLLSSSKTPLINNNRRRSSMHINTNVSCLKSFHFLRSEDEPYSHLFCADENGTLELFDIRFNRQSILINSASSSLRTGARLLHAQMQSEIHAVCVTEESKLLVFDARKPGLPIVNVSLPSATSRAASLDTTSVIHSRVLLFATSPSSSMLTTENKCFNVNSFVDGKMKRVPFDAIPTTESNNFSQVENNWIFDFHTNSLTFGHVHGDSNSDDAEWSGDKCVVDIYRPSKRSDK